ncbi:MAG: RDD family protein [Actinomycetota bacterium]|nr:RDD family protein [Actinomycetota bacterium]
MPETDTEFSPPPGWGTPFPPEQPRRDAVQDAMPTAAAVAAASFTGEEVRVNPRFEDRRRLDRRRTIAHVIDEVVLVLGALVGYFLFNGAAVGTVVVYLALKLSYYLVLETAFGQTLGKKLMRLRVVTLDGDGVPANKVAARTIFRFIDEGAAVGFLPVIALISWMLTGPKRQRLGDIAAGTCVREADRDFKPAADSPLVVVYPVLWIGAALAAGAALPDKPFLEYFRSEHPYMAKIDKICEKRVRQTKAMQSIEGDNIITWRIFFRQEQKKIEELPTPPKEVRADVKEVIRIHRQFNRELDKVLNMARNAPDPMAVLVAQAPHMQTLAENAGERFAELGLPYCAQ